VEQLSAAGADSRPTWPLASCLSAAAITQSSHTSVERCHQATSCIRHAAMTAFTRCSRCARQNVRKVLSTQTRWRASTAWRGSSTRNRASGTRPSSLCGAHCQRTVARTQTYPDMLATRKAHSPVCFLLKVAWSRRQLCTSACWREL
jgi:hypothetical protein